MRSLRCYVCAVLLLIVALFSLSCSQTHSLTILHTNDIHAAFIPHEATWIREIPKPMIGGFEELWQAIDSIRQIRQSTLTLDGGDVMTGTPISEIPFQGTLGGGLFEMMNMIGYDAWTIGNHDLDISQDNLRELTRIAHFPTVSANLVDSAKRLILNNQRYVILKKDGLRIGIIGLMSPDLYQLTNTNNLSGLMVLSAVAVTQSIIDFLDAETDLLIAVTHQGVDEDSMLAAGTHGLDVIIGGHSHTRLQKPKYINNVIICQTGSSCENLGLLDLTIENDHVVNYEGKLVPLWVRRHQTSSPLASLIGDFKSTIDKEYGEVLGTLATDWKRSGGGETPIGNFVAEAIREGAGAQIAVTNSSGIRKDLSAGPVTKLDLFEISPFRNTLCTFIMTGKEVRDFALRNARMLADKKSNIQTSGIQCTWKRTNGTVELVNVMVNGTEVDDGTEYVCATSDFVVNQGDKYLGMIPRSVVYSKTTISEALSAKTKREGAIHPYLEPKFKENH